MPLSPPAEREALHVRQIECRGYRRLDGLWDIEAHLVDTKEIETDRAWGGKLPAGAPVHDMWVRLTIDGAMKVHGAEAAMETTPYPPCARAAPSLAVLVGHTIAPGWSMLVKRLLGGVKSCTHVMELLMPVATTAYQTLGMGRRAREQRAAASRTRPGKIDSCYAYSSQREVVARFWPEFYEGP